MAKIYETKKDIDREILVQGAKEARNNQTTALTWLGTGLALLTFGLLKKKPVPEIAIPKDAGFWRGVWDRFREGPIHVNGIVLRSWDDSAEKQAYWLGAAALLPERVLKGSRTLGKTIEDVAEEHAVSIPLVKFRTQILGIPLNSSLS